MKRSATITKTPGAKRTRFSKPNYSAKAILRRSTVVAPTRRNVELKRRCDPVLTAINSINLAGAGAPLPLIAAGNESSERDGRAIQLKAWEIRGNVWSSINIGTSHIRVVVLMWRQPESGTPNPSVILELAGGTIDPCFASYNIENAANYTILADKTYNVCPQSLNIAQDAFNPNGAYVHLYGKLNEVQTYSGTGGNNVCDKQVYVLVCPDGASNNCVLNGAITFVDI